MLNTSLRYQDGELFCDDILVKDIVAFTGTPVYIYSFKRVLENFRRIRAAFAPLDAHIHYSAKANANLALLQTLVGDGAGIDAVSAGEIHRALKAGANPADIVFAGVGKTPNELGYALERGIGWVNVENTGEIHLINQIIAALDRSPARVALRFNPDITANTHPHIATGHGGAKFGLTAETIRGILARRGDYPHVSIEGIHLHIGSQLHDTAATCKAVEAALKLIAPYPDIRTVNIGGGLPVAYRSGEELPTVEQFAATLAPLLKGYRVILEPGRSIIADAGMLIASVIYTKRQAGQTFLITDASMAELIRPALYEAYHEIIPVFSKNHDSEALQIVNVVGPVCETTDVLGKQIPLPD
ncbi:MAG: diaminopimelate decarboxylase, partial [Anaerolineae bacterium]|nr:diaminopimelate decarboxylase [Anaerolineae bacterium]